MRLSDEALYQRWVEGELSAFDALYARFERPLFGFLLNQLQDAAAAEDALHEAFLAVLQERATGRNARSFKPWLFQVARNLCLNAARARSRGERALEKVAGAPVEHATDPAGALEAREASAALQQAVQRLPEKLAELYPLRAAGLSYEEISEVLGVPLGTVKSRMHELVGRLREEVSPWTAR